MKNSVVILFVLFSFSFLLSMSAVVAQELCEGNTDYDQDIDGADVSVFKADFGRNQYNNPCPPDGPAPVPKTGQTIQYSVGDDGNYQAGVELSEPRFTDNEDGTVTDNLTELMWLQNANFAGEKKTWQEALDYIEAMNNGGGTFGYNDWRLPDINEIWSLVDYGETLPVLPLGHPFINVQINPNGSLASGWYWTNSVLGISTNSICLQMHAGNIWGDDQSSVQFFWPVRGPE